MSSLWLQAKRRRQHDKTNPWKYALNLGFFAGIIWSIVHWLFYLMKFTLVIPGYLAEPFFQRAFLNTWFGLAVSIGAFIVFSIAAAFIYQFALVRFKGPWMGLAYGAAWWFILFVVIGPWLGMMDPLHKIGWNSIISELCLYLLWGIFIGYSVAFEFHDEASREPANAH